MIRALAMILALTACRSRSPDRFEGVPPGSHPVCTWDRINTGMSVGRGQCIVDGTRLRCFRQAAEDADHVWFEISCAPYKIFR